MHCKYIYNQQLSCLEEVILEDSMFMSIYAQDVLKCCLCRFWNKAIMSPCSLKTLSVMKWSWRCVYVFVTVLSLTERVFAKMSAHIWLSLFLHIFDSLCFSLFHQTWRKKARKEKKKFCFCFFYSHHHICFGCWDCIQKP